MSQSSPARRTWSVSRTKCANWMPDGYPIAIEAEGGGRGRGMKIVRSEAEVAEA